MSHFSKISLCLSIFFLFTNALFGQATISRTSLVYKEIDSVSLSMDLYYPEDSETKKRPAIIFFFGGGWKKGEPKQFEHHAIYFAKRGMVAILADYRVFNRHGTTPFEALKDAKSAIRFLRKNADTLQIIPDKIVAAGGSAGGQLAAAAALTSAYEEKGVDLAISSSPNVLILFNPVIDNGPGGYGFDRIGDEYRQFSPLHNLKVGAPSTLIFLGTEDKYVPVETAEYYKMVMEKVGSRCDLHLYEGQKHGFFNYENKKYFLDNLHKADKFLISLDYLKGEPLVEPLH